MTPSWFRLLCFTVGGLLGLSALVAQERPSDVLKRAAPPAASEDSEERVSADAEVDSSEDVDSAADGSEPAESPVGAAQMVPFEGGATAIVIPINDQIAAPIVYIVRRGLKEAVAQNAQVVILDINTPGGRVDKMLEIMDMLDRFDGLVIAYVNDEAISAGALITAVADEIWMEPRGVIGSAGIVMGGGQEVPETMKQKVESYVQAKLRALSTPHPYREQVIEAMMDAEMELIIDGETISPEGKMLNLTAKQAVQVYGTPPTPLFADGIADNVEDLLSQRFGPNEWNMVRFEVTWSEELAKYLTAVAPLLISLGIIGLFIEFKSPGFGIFGIAGITCLAIVFASNYVAGLAGMEPLIVLILGLALIAVDIFLLPGTIVPSVIGFFLVIGSLLWSMADVWPNPDNFGGFDVREDALLAAAGRLSGAILLSIILGPIIYWLLLKARAFDSLILGAKGQPALAGDVTLPGHSYIEVDARPAIGARGVVTRPLHPLGEVEIEGQRHTARVSVGSLPRGAAVEVTGHATFALEVKPVEDAS